MDNTAFKPGDLVRLKSGGPAMTVDHLQQGPDYPAVVWFGGCVQRRDVFPAECLERVYQVNWPAPNPAPDVPRP